MLKSDKTRGDLIQEEYPTRLYNSRLLLFEHATQLCPQLFDIHGTTSYLCSSNNRARTRDNFDPILCLSGSVTQV